MTVLHLQILLHYYSRCDDWECPTPTHNDFRLNLVVIGLLEPRKTAPPFGSAPTEYAITEKGRAHVEGLCDAPLPQQSWISPIREAP